MTHTPQQRNATFSHIVMQGSPYDIGALQGAALRGVPAWVEFMRSGRQLVTREQARSLASLFQQYVPDLYAEAEGLAAGLRADPEELIFFVQSYLVPGACSQFAVHSSITREGRILIGRSYEFADREDDLRLCTTAVNGRLRHSGFSLMVLGRMDGMNERGLCVTTSSGGLPVGYKPPLSAPPQAGFQFWVLVRAILENAASVEDGLNILRSLPLSCNTNLIISSADGRAALVEVDGPRHAVRWLGEPGAETALISTNHTVLQSSPYPVFPNSFVRYHQIGSRLQQNAPDVTLASIKDILAEPYPKGLCCPYYDEYFGTLHSMVFDPASQVMEVCFGAPTHNPWRRFDLTQPQEISFIPAVLPLEKAPS